MARVNAEIYLTDRHGGRVPLPRPGPCGGLERATRRSGASSERSAVMPPSTEVVRKVTTMRSQEPTIGHPRHRSRVRRPIHEQWVAQLTLIPVARVTMED